MRPDRPDDRPCCEGPPGRCGPETVSIGRRGFLAATGLAAASVLRPVTDREAPAGPFTADDFERLIPRDKKLRPDWLRSLTDRGRPEVYRGADLDHVGMPVGGIACGQLYLGGDGRLWYWDIFTSVTTTAYDEKIWAGPHYEHPLRPAPAVLQGFALRVKSGGKTVTRTLDRRGFPGVTFRGEYPVGKLTYADPEVPVTVQLDAFSPFIPLDEDDSSLPATVFSFTVTNPGREPAEVSLDGWLENAVCRNGDGGLGLRRRNAVVRDGRGATTILMTAEPSSSPAPPRPDVVFADFEGKDYAGWTAEGEAFGERPYREDEKRFYNALSGYEGKGFVNTHVMRHGEDSVRADRPTGRLTSPEFTVERSFIRFRIGGGSDASKLGLRLLVDGREVRRAAGRNEGPMKPGAFDVREFAGRKARLVIVDDATGGWGHTTVDQIVFSDRPIYATPADVPGFGSMALTVLGEGARADTRFDLRGEPEAEGVELVDRASEPPSLAPLGQRLVGALGRTKTVPPGGTARFDFVLTWHFPTYGSVTGEMAAIQGMPGLRRHYAKRFADAGAVAAYVAENFPRLSETTLLWNRTWYDSTLPYWLLDRTFVTLDCLATQAFHRFDNGRYWGWEGVDCCPGTCQHVWHYAQAVGRVFPGIERDLRERVDFGLAWHESGAMDYRAENARQVAHDGFCGTILRAYREHLTSPDGAFLARLWPKVRRSLVYLLGQDRDADGLLEGEQMNTLDAAWFGPMGWISSLYVATLHAGAAMAEIRGDGEFAARCRKVAEAGRRNLVARLFNGEYFIHKPDPAHPQATNTNDGCHIDQVFGQSWAWQVGLPRAVPEKECRQALQSLWRYNATPDVGPWRDGMKKALPAGRWYAMPGEGGLVMCTWPRGGAEKAAGTGNPTFVGYFTECMTGFEYQVASHMIWEGLVTEGLALTRLVHDRYHASRRNPYNEVECSDHYSRAMAGYGVFLAACGFEYDGPRGHLGFAPRVAAADFRAPFTAAEGWGTIAQQRGATHTASVNVRHGMLRLASLALAAPGGRPVTRAVVTLNGDAKGHRLTRDGDRVTLTLDAAVTLKAGETLHVELS